MFLHLQLQYIEKLMNLLQQGLLSILDSRYVSAGKKERDGLNTVPVCMLHPYHFCIFEEKMKKVMEVYNYEWTDEEL